MELNEKLARWAGIKVLGIVPDGTPEGSYWGEMDLTGFAVYPGESDASKLCDFTSSLDACFKWLVPKLREYGIMMAILDDFTWLFNIYNEKSIHDGVGETPALALCKAIEQLIDEETP